MGDNDARKRFSNEFWLTILIFSVATAFGAGGAVLGFETKAASEQKQAQMTEYVNKTFMPRELSQERWANNEKVQAEIKAALDDILKEMRRNNRGK